MNKRFVIALLLAASSVPAWALSPRVFVSGSGTDTGPCSVNAPCRNFTYAIGQVSAGGEIVALDTAGYGTVTIAKSVTVLAAPGAIAFIAASSGTAVTINAGANDVVTLRGLSLTSVGATIGIDFQSGFNLNVERCVVKQFAIGIRFSRTADGAQPRIQVVESAFRNNNTGVQISDTVPWAFLTVANSTFIGNITQGVLAADNSRVAISESVFAGNFLGVAADSATASGIPPQVHLEGCSFSRNSIAVSSGHTNAVGTRGLVHMANCFVTTNGTGVRVFTDGVLDSRSANGLRTNTVEGNTTNISGALTTFAAQ